MQKIFGWKIFVQSLSDENFSMTKKKAIYGNIVEMCYYTSTVLGIPYASYSSPIDEVAICTKNVVIRSLLI